MDYLLHPRKFFRDVQTWRQRQNEKYVVVIDNPRMKIKGKTYKNETNDPKFPTYVAFFGVPYAAAPVGPLRFQPPQPYIPAQSGELLKAYETDHACLQYQANLDGRTLRYRGSEDCLYLNIYLPKKPSELLKNTPVLVYIHGGGFVSGSGDIEDVKPDAIIKQNLIFVTINYRLNVFGFLNMGTKDCCGNAGLKDQVQALKWIQANIEKFGGDPQNVTITGHSAGATCVNLHMISPLSKGLFHKAIVKGGGIYTPWGFHEADKNLRTLFAEECGVDNELRDVLVTCLKRQTAVNLLNVASKIGDQLFNLEPNRMKTFIGPSLEAFKEGAFIPCKVEELMRKAEPIPLIAGMVEQEGYMYIFDEYQAHRDGYGELVKDDQRFIIFLMENLRWNHKTALKYKDSLRKRYFPGLKKRTTQEIQDFLATLVTDIWFRRFYDNFKIGETPAPYYIYRFSYLPRNNQERWTEIGDCTLRIMAPTHGDEFNYLYYPQGLGEICSEHSIRAQAQHVINHMCSMWGNFCRSGNPKSEYENVEWVPHTEEEPCYLNINASSALVKLRLFENRWKYLNEIIMNEPSVETPTIRRPPSNFGEPSTRKS